MENRYYVCDMVRQNCILFNYVGTDIKDESETDQLRSILAQKEFTYEISRLDKEKSLPFRTHLYVPESIPLPELSDEQRCILPYHEREDEPHLLKVEWRTINNQLITLVH